MYVDVIACKRGRIKVDVTLAKRGAVRTVSPVPTVISIPVKKAATSAAEDTTDAADIFAGIDIPAEEIAAAIEAEQEPSEDSAAEDMDSVMELLELAGGESSDDESDEAELIGLFDDVSTAEEEITAIDELLAGADEEISEEILDDIVADALDELDDMSRRTDVMRERLDGQLAEALEEINDSADEDAETLTSIIGRELESLDSVLIQRDDTAEAADSPEEIPHPADTSAYMRYFDRDAQGDRVEASRDNATGQEVICIDETSGRLSRVCGIIRKDGDKNENN